MEGKYTSSFGVALSLHLLNLVLFLLKSHRLREQQAFIRNGGLLPQLVISVNGRLEIGSCIW